jgi:hypothetical protein
LYLFEEQDKDDPEKTENYLVLNVKDKVFAMSAYFEEPVIPPNKFYQVTLKGEQLYYVDFRDKRKIFSLEIFNVPHSKEVLVLTTASEIVYFSVSDDQDLLYTFELSSELMKAVVYKKVKTTFNTLCEFYFKDNDHFPTSFEGRNMFVQNQFIYYMNDLYYLDVTKETYKKAELFKDDNAE